MKLAGRNLSVDLQGDDVALLHTELTAIGLAIPPGEVAKKAFGQGTLSAVQQFQKQVGLQVTGVVDQRTATQINLMVDGHQPEAQRTVSGVVAAPARGTIPELTVVVSDRSLRREDVLATTQTDAEGRYVATYLLSAVQARGKAAPDLVVSVQSGQTTLGTSQVRYDASAAEVIDVLLDADPAGLVSEHQAISHAVAAHFAGGLQDLREDDENADLTYLSRKTGWDARAVALAATSAQLADAAAQQDGAALGAEHFYALLRSGVAATPEAVFSLHPAMVEQVWKQAVQAGFVSDEVGRTSEVALRTYRRLAVAHSLDVAAVPGTSTLRQLAQRVLGDDAQAQQTFAELLAKHKAEPTALWRAVGDALGADKATALRLDGQLALLTMDNAPLVARVHAAVGGTLSSAADLPHAGFHDAAAWLPLLANTAPPDVITGPDDEDRRRRYADVLAAQVRMSYPTAVTAALVDAGTVPVTTAKDDVHRFLTEHADSFQIGMEPVRRYVARVGAAVDPEVVTQVQRLQRIYQLTRDDTAMAALLHAGVDSAAAAVRLGTPQLMKAVGDTLGETAVRQISAKALQVHLATLNVAGAYLTTRAAPALGGDAARILEPDASLGGPQAAAAAGAPDLDQLFGSMDLCGCDECRSVLSPAAYLVDLLDFADRPTSDGSPTPLQVLLQRRPDLQHLPLSCENTNTALPYIDVVNETLEHFVVHGLSLADYTGHDTGEQIRTEDLLASPQFVEEAAYTLLKNEAFPPPLPFHRPLQQLRRYVRVLTDGDDTDLATVLDDLRAGDAIERTPGTGYGTRDILMERLGLSRQEHALLTTHTTTLPELYGLATGTTPEQAVTALSNAKAFARQARIGYDDVAALVTTRFVNPNAVLIPALRHLGLAMATLARVHAGTITDPELAALLPDGVSTVQVHDFVIENYEQARQLVVLQQRPERDPCDFASFALAHNDPDAAENTLTTTQFVQLARFIRLWRTLGWTVAQTDAAVAALYPATDLSTDPDPEVALTRLDAGFATMLLRLGVLHTVLTRLRIRPGDQLEPLLALWSPIASTAPGSLYERLFLAPAVLSGDPAFARNRDGSVLTDGTRQISAHADALRAATGLTGPELEQVFARLPQAGATALSIDAVSAVYRHAWLARRLRLSIAELTTLIDHTGLDPFAMPEPDGVHHQPALLDLLDLLDELRAARIKPAQFAYLAFDTDLTGTSATRATDVTALARTLRSGFADVDAQFAVIDDPTGEIARARLALVYGEPAADLLFGLVNGTFTVTRAYSFEHPDEFAGPLADATGGRLAYDDLLKTLSYAGVLQPDVRAAIAAIANIPATLMTAVDDLAAQGAAQTAAFFARYPELEAGYRAFLASHAPLEQRRATLLARFLPVLIRRRRAQQALACLSAVLRVSPLLTSAVADNAAVLHAEVDPGGAALVDLTSMATTGLDTRLFWSATVGTVPDLQPDPTPTLDYGAGQPLPRGPGGLGSPVSGTWTGHLEAATSDTYELAIDADAAAVRLLLEGVPAPLDHDGARWRTHDPLRLTAGTLLAVQIIAEQVGPDLTLRQRSTGLGWQVVPAARLYPASAMQRLATTYARVGKTVSLATGPPTPVWPSPAMAGPMRCGTAIPVPPPQIRP
jgi:peptidoglycan hydrolase-like protein with peptidoglycan-binding domain